MDADLHFAFYEPDIPQNVGGAVRLAAALSCPLHLIEPFGFVFTPQKLHRAALDYHAHATLRRYAGWSDFESWLGARGARVILLTTRGCQAYATARFHPGDVLLCGRESSGVPDHIHAAAELRLVIPMHPAVRSLNVVTALAMVAGEALRQLRGDAAGQANP